MQTHAAQMATPSMALDKQLRDIKLHGVLQRRQLGQALNAKEFAVLAGLSYSTARAWFRLPGFPVIKGVIFWGDFIEWRRARTGLSQAAKGPAAFYGSSITQGGCASRPGMAFTAVAGRLADVPVVNLGFSGNGKMEMALCDLLAEIDAAAYVLDCLWNMSDDLVKERAEPFIRALQQKRPGTPILLAEDCNPFDSAPTSKARLLRGIYDKLKAEDAARWQNLHYLEAKDMLGHDGEGTVDGCHPTDLGMERQGEVFGAALKKLLAP